MLLFIFYAVSIFLLKSAALPDTNCTSGIDCDGPSLSCPSDSVIIRTDGICTCDQSLCKSAPICYDHQEQLLVKTATQIPGECCDEYECRDKPGINCDEVDCPKEVEQCPPDSYQLPYSSHITDCCGKALGCQCLPTCAEPNCLDGEVAKIVRYGNATPGTCCPIYQCISTSSTEYCENGTTWKNSDCEECKCDKGIKFCAKIECPKLPLPCTKVEKPKGQCCPVCLEESILDSNDEGSAACLLANGTLVYVGEVYFPDPCTNCTCLGGGRPPHCTASMCRVPCINPRYVEGECCPLCDAPDSMVLLHSNCSDLSNCTLRCKDGFVKSEDGCLTCKCQEEKCVLDCVHGYITDTNGYNLCECVPPPIIDMEPTCPSMENCYKKCPHGRKRKQGCEVCRCAQCPSINNCEKKCTNGYMIDENDCHMCRCQPSSIVNNTACYSTDGVWRDDSELWQDGCRECHCINGREMCTLVSCPSLSCEEPLPPNSTQCCPYCPGSPDKFEASVCMNFHGELKLEGQKWTLNACTDCTCKGGKVLCYSQQCPPAACSNPVQPEPGYCCPVCANSNEITAIVISDDNGDSDCGDKKNGSSWRESNCVSCRCELGHKICYQQECPQSDCNRSVQPKNACCSICLDSALKFGNERGCIDGNVTYKENQEWSLDPCTTCTCKAGSRQCTQKICSVACAKPVKIPNQCCPICLVNQTTPKTDPIDSTTTKQIKETLYILLIVLFCVCTLFAIYACRQLRVRRNQLRLQDYGCPPPQYQYKYIPTYEGPNTRSKTMSEEKTSLAPV